MARQFSDGGIRIPVALQARADPDLRARMKEFADEMGITNIASVIRTLMAAGLAKANEVEVAIRRAGYDEGVRQGYAETLRRLSMRRDAGSTEENS